jgi:prolipoprotein diacylglyceryl transferase
MTLALLIAEIPSPSRGVINVGPVPVRAYALCILLGVFVAIAVARRRWAARGGDPKQIGDLAVWAVPAGLVGARLYHVATDYQLYTDDPAGALHIWDGGLGIWGGVAGGAVVGLWVARRWGMNTSALLDAAAPAIPLAQAIGRWGNWFNQELFGRPTSLPWGLRIDPENRPKQFAGEATFHPTFLYECLWNLVVVAIVLAVERRGKLRPGRLFAVYVAAYTFGRFWIELLRVDPANRIYGLRVNDWVSLVVFVVAMVFVVTGRRRRGADDTLTPAEPEPLLVGAADRTASAGGSGDPDRHHVEEGVGEHRRADPAQADGDAEDDAGGGDGDDHADVAQAQDRVEVGEAEEHGRQGDGAHGAHAVQESALKDAPEEELLHDRRPHDGEDGHHDEARGIAPEHPEQVVVPPDQAREGQEGDDGDGNRDAAGDGHEEAPADVAPGHDQPEIAEQVAGAEPPAHHPAGPEQTGPEPGLAYHQPHDPGQPERRPEQAQHDRGGHPDHEPDQGDDGGPTG